MTSKNNEEMDVDSELDQTQTPNKNDKNNASLIAEDDIEIASTLQKGQEKSKEKENPQPSPSVPADQNQNQNQNKNESPENQNQPEKASSPSKKDTNSNSMNNQKKKELRKKLKLKLNNYRKIVTEGCDDWRCLNPHCKSNEINENKSYTDAEASQLALKMFKLKIKPCNIYGRRAITPLKYEHILSVINQTQDQDQDQDQNEDELKDDNTAQQFELNNESENKSDACARVVHIIQQTFTHLDILQESFLTSKRPNDNSSEINFDELDKTFRAIVSDDSLKETMIECLIETLENFVTNSTPNMVTDLESLRVLLILIENPVIFVEDSENHETLFLKLLSIIENVEDKYIKILETWFSNYSDTTRLKRLLDCLHMFMTLEIEINEDTIEDASNEWMVEFNYDNTEEQEEREDIERRIEKRQQRKREAYITKSISKIVKMIDIIFAANNKIIESTAEIKKCNEKYEDDDEDEMDMEIVEDELKTDPNPNTNKRVSLVGISSLNVELPLTLFHNDGLNETICSNDHQRIILHQRDFIHWKDKDFFTFLDHAHLLTPGSKSRYLEFENLLRQYHARRRRMFDLMFAGNVMVNRDRLMQELDLVLNVRRESIVSDTLGILQLQEPPDLRKRLRIVFDQEQGFDQGGLTKEYFQLICQELFDASYGMFVLQEQTQVFWFNCDAFLLCEHKVMEANYELIGKLIGIALYNNTILDLKFPKVMFKKLLGHEVDFNDFRDFDPEMAKGFETLLTFDGDVESVYCRSFTHERNNVFDVPITTNLKENGKDIALTKQNRREYVDLYIKHVLMAMVQDQFNAFKRGFKMVCDSALFSKFVGEELELLVCGSQEFDFEALEKSARYEDGLHKKSKLVTDFWDVAHNLSEVDKRNLLKFCTGSDRVPIRGLGALRLKISKNGTDNTKLPTSHTCFNHLLLPEYSSREILKQRLLLAIQNAEGFGLL